MSDKSSQDPEVSGESGIREPQNPEPITFNPGFVAPTWESTGNPPGFQPDPQDDWDRHAPRIFD